MNSEREKADILFDYGLPFAILLPIWYSFYTLLFLRVATLSNMLEGEGVGGGMGGVSPTLLRLGPFGNLGTKYCAL